MVEKIRELFSRVFFRNWQRKTLSVFLAVFLWLFVTRSLISTRTFANVGIRVTNIPEHKTIEGLQTDGILDRKVTLTLTGNGHLIQELTPEDLIIDVDASNIVR